MLAVCFHSHTLPGLSAYYAQCSLCNARPSQHGSTVPRPIPIPHMSQKSRQIKWSHHWHKASEWRSKDMWFESLNSTPLSFAAFCNSNRFRDAKYPRANSNGSDLLQILQGQCSFYFIKVAFPPCTYKSFWPEDADLNYSPRKTVLKGAEILSSLSNLTISIFNQQNALS